MTEQKVKPSKPSKIITAYKTDTGYVLSEDNFKENAGYYNTFAIMINGKKIEEHTRVNKAVIIEGEITSVSRVVTPKRIRTGFKLKRAIDGLREFIPANEIKVDDDGEWEGEHAGFEKLYEETYDTVPGGIEEIAFTVNISGNVSISDLNNVSEMKVHYKNDDRHWNNSNTTLQMQLDSCVTYSDLENMLVPDFLLQTRPCSLTSKQMYNIVRGHLLANMPADCKATSNYDFCFTVKKTINVPAAKSAVPVAYNNLCSVNPDQLQVDVFRMSYAGYQKGNKGYDGYPCIPAMEGKNLADLHKKVLKLLENITLHIADIRIG